MKIVSCRSRGLTIMPCIFKHKEHQGFHKGHKNKCYLKNTKVSGFFVVVFNI